MPHILHRPSWYLPENSATPEGVFINRRSFLKTLGIGGAVLATAGCGLRSFAQDVVTDTPRPGGPLPQYTTNPKYADAGREVTDEEYPLTYNNFYEFSFSKSGPQRATRDFKLDPYLLHVDGLVDKPMEFDLDQIEALGVEERIYRFRCVEAWAMTVPWLGVPLHKLLDKIAIKPEAKYVRFETFLDPEQAPNQTDNAYNWPYYEGLRLDEARNELSFVTIGHYGKRLAPQSGTPLRIILPWKYGFKGGKSVVRMSFVADQPSTFWNDAVPSEYKFYSNVDPKVPHPRWSQANERWLGESVKSHPTEWYNGYGEQVAELYTDLPRALI